MRTLHLVASSEGFAMTGLSREGWKGRKVRSTGAKRTPEQPDPKGHAQNSEKGLGIREK